MEGDLICSFSKKKVYKCVDEPLCSQDPSTNIAGWEVDSQFKMPYTLAEIQRKQVYRYYVHNLNLEY